jgi:hypothetical protein
LAAVPLFRVESVIMTDDSPLMCCWVWASVWSHRAIVRDDLRAWLFAGLLGAAGVLAKYTMLALPASVGLFLLTSSEARRQLRRPGFWLMAAACSAGLIPIIAWNIRHGWVGAGQLFDRVGLAQGEHDAPILALVNFLGGEVLVLGIWWLFGVLAIVSALTLVARRRVGPPVLWRQKLVTRHEPGERAGLTYLLSLWVVVWSACAAASLAGESEANWAAPSYVAVVALIGWWLDRKIARSGPRARAVVAKYSVAWALCMVLLMTLQHTEWLYPLLRSVVPQPTAKRPAPMHDLDATCKMRGYRDLAREVSKILAKARAEGLDPFIMTPTYPTCTALSFYLPGHPETFPLNYSTKGPTYPANQHDLWRPNPRLDPDAFHGRSAVIVHELNEANFAHRLVHDDWFDPGTPTKRVVVTRHGVPVSAWGITILHHFRGNPELRTTPPPL